MIPWPVSGRARTGPLRSGVHALSPHALVSTQHPLQGHPALPRPRPKWIPQERSGAWDSEAEGSPPTPSSMPHRALALQEERPGPTSPYLVAC